MSSYASEKLFLLSLISDDISKHNMVLVHKQEYIQCLNMCKISWSTIHAKDVFVMQHSAQSNHQIISKMILNLYSL